MSYTPTEWKTGDVVTAEKLNKVENELGKNGLIIIPDIMVYEGNNTATIEAGLTAQDFMSREIIIARNGTPGKFRHIDWIDIDDYEIEEVEIFDGESIHVLINGGDFYYNPTTGSIRYYNQD